MGKFRVIPKVEVLNRHEPLALMLHWGAWHWYYRHNNGGAQQ